MAYRAKNKYFLDKFACRRCASVDLVGLYTMNASVKCVSKYRSGIQVKYWGLTETNDALSSMWHLQDTHGSLAIHAFTTNIACRHQYMGYSVTLLL